jgi:hypothetical protein
MTPEVEREWRWFQIGCVAVAVILYLCLKVS